MATLKKQSDKKQPIEASNEGNKGKKTATPKKVENTKVETKPPKKEKMVTVGTLYNTEQAELVKLLFKKMDIDLDEYVKRRIVIMINEGNGVKLLSKEEKEKYRRYLSI